ncbi:hypothetical protein HanPI659440_Chr13g0499931 [Helianthus annuus]|nr:hypothetical protein HanPI659440_Chr13g0499931 [Helianthus annuus]
MSGSNEDWFHSILKTESPPSSTARIHRVPMILKEHIDHEKYYVPKVASLGPYHHGNPNLESVEGFKPLYTNKLLEGNQESIRSLYHSLAKMVRTLKGIYEDDVDHLSDDEFTRMMLLDGCFILYVIEHIFLNNEKDNLGLKSHQIMFIQQDMFLLENQIPYQVLTEVMKFVPYEFWDMKIKRFIDDNILAAERCRVSGAKLPKLPVDGPVPDTINHLLELLQTRLTKDKPRETLPNDRYTFRNVNELKEVGIRFKPSRTRSIAQIKFSKCGFFANIELPPITVDDSTKPMLLNLVAYEMCSNDTNESWVTSYICLLDSLIDHAEDVKVLRKAGILDNQLGSDEEVAGLFNEIGRDLVPNNFAYSAARSAIQKHYESKRNTWISQLKHEYIKTPWAFVALLAGLVGLFLSSVQTYYSVFGGQSHCDSLCLYLKNHHQP